MEHLYCPFWENLGDSIANGGYLHHFAFVLSYLVVYLLGRISK